MVQINCIIVDDEPLALDLLQGYLDKISYVKVVGRCYDALEAMKILEQSSIDLVFLDINMPHLNGLEFSALLPNSTHFIFTTAYSEYAVESYEKNAIDYLVKPIKFDRFLQAVSKVKDKIHQSQIETSKKLNHIFVKSGKKLINIKFDEVTYIEGMKDYAVFHYNKENVWVGKTLKELEVLLPENFQRVHISYFVNFDHIVKIEDNHIYLSSIKIPISAKFRDAVQERINKRMF